MSEQGGRRNGELVRGVFQILLDHPDGLRAREVIRRLEEVVPPTEFENTTYPDRPNIRRYGKTVRFATITAVKAGWLVKEKGLWTLTEDGRNAFHRYTDPLEFRLEARRLYKQWKADQPPSVDDSNEDSSESESTASTTLEEAEESAWAELESHLGEMNPYDFQELVAALIRAMGYHVSWVSPPGPDKGIDILAHLDPLGIEGPRIKVQVKRRADRSRVDTVRAFKGVLGGNDVGIFVSSGGFTSDAQEFVRGEGSRIMLIDLRRLLDLWIEHYEKIAERHRRLLPLRAVYFLAPDDD